MALLEMRDIKKSFYSNKVLQDVQLQVEAGSVHALMGENGAGKSTLMKILAGVHNMDSGSIEIDGSKVDINSPSQAQRQGVAMIHQELSSLLDMTVAENIFLSREPGKMCMVDYKQMYRKTTELMERLKMSINPKAKMRSLRVADQQMVEIAKAISLDARIIIMDEPTSAITDREVDTLFEIIRSLTKQGKAIVYISHKMDEVFRICDHITVLRDGQYVGSWSTDEINHDTLIKNMVGRELNEIFPKSIVPIGENLLEVRNLSCKGQFEDISFTVRQGEILGVAGLVSAGRTEVMHTLFGLSPAESGEIIFEGKRIHPKRPSDAIGSKIAYVTEDRKEEGLVLPMSVAHNITLSSMKRFCRGLIDRKKERETIVKQIESLRIKVQTPKHAVASLSGGNQQKVVLAKWLLDSPKLLILDEPTRGIDVGAKAEIYKLMCEFVAKGNAIIMVSSEMPEVMGMADRILVLSNRRMGGELEKQDFSQENIMQLAVCNM